MPVAMQRLSVVVLQRDEHPVLRGLGRLGAVHLVRQPAGPETAPLSPPDRSADLARCDELLSRLDALCRKLGIEALPPPSTGPAPVRLEEADRRLRAIEEPAGQVLARCREVDDRRVRATDLLERVRAYEGLQLPMGAFSDTSFLHFATGILPVESLGPLQASVGENVVLLPLRAHDGHRHIIAITSRKGRFALETALEKAGFRPDTLVVPPGQSPERLAERARAERDQSERELAEANAAVGALAEASAQTLADLGLLVAAERQVLDAQQNFARTEATVLITGWVPAGDLPAVRVRLQETTAGRCAIEAADPDDVPESEIPVLLRHPQVLRPFEMLVANYGLPTYREFEPTLFVAISYVLMFGMMFGDAGNGLAVALVGLGLLLKGRTVTVRDAGQLMLYLGLSSVGFGIYYGSYFGVTEIGGRELGSDPLKGSPMLLMVAAVIFGILLMSVGLVLNIVNRFRRGDVLGALMDRFGLAGVAFYWGCLGLLVYVAVLKAGDVPWWLALGVIVLPLAAMALKGPLHLMLARCRPKHEGAHAEAGLGEAVVESAVEAFEAILGYLANTISFVRLAAYAMSHAAVLMASFAIAGQFEKGLGAGLGTAVGIVVIVVGNIVAILLEGVVASVQALRLEYYEFFGKFFSGAGQAFRPFRLLVKDQVSPR
jgi:V/A-type H+-transporting ATPase subunit I